jgi:hypothetical protein
MYRMIVEWRIVKRKKNLRKWLWPNVRYCRSLYQYRVRKTDQKAA